MHIVNNIAVDAYKIDDLYRQLGVTYPPQQLSPPSISTLVPRQAANIPYPPQGRNCTLTSLAGTMRSRGMGEAAIEAALKSHNSSYPIPLPDYEVVRIARSVSRYPVQQSANDILQSLDDIGNAKRLITLFGDDLRFIPERKTWMAWDGERWKVDDHGVDVTELAKAAVAIIDAEAAMAVTLPGVHDVETLVKSIRRWARSSGMLVKLKAMLDLAGKDPRVSLPVGRLDSDKMLLGVANGVINLKTGKLCQNRKEDYITRFSPVPHDLTASCPQWHKFLNKVTGLSGVSRWERRDRRRIKELLAYLRRVVGYSLTGRTDEQVLFFLHGHGANGKTVFMNLLEHMLGSRLALQTPSETLMASKQQGKQSNDLARLANVRLVLSNELEDGVLAEEMIKQMTGDDSISCRFLYQEYFEFKPAFKLFMSGNHKPIIRNQDFGIWRRINLIPFEVTIPLEDRDPLLGQKLRAEASGILNWAIKGCLAWQKNRLKPPGIITDAVKAYQDEMDLIGQWMEEDCEIGPDFSCKARDAYGISELDGYQWWCRQNGLRPHQ